jgi:hypothetical protein
MQEADTRILRGRLEILGMVSSVASTRGAGNRGRARPRGGGHMALRQRTLLQNVRNMGIASAKVNGERGEDKAVDGGERRGAEDGVGR